VTHLATETAKLVAGALAAEKRGVSAQERGYPAGDVAHRAVMPFLVVHHQPLLGPKLGDRRRHPHQCRIVVASEAGEDAEASA
jgi:hypothetical protein